MLQNIFLDLAFLAGLVILVSDPIKYINTMLYHFLVSWFRPTLHAAFSHMRYDVDPIGFDQPKDDMSLPLSGSFLQS